MARVAKKKEEAVSLETVLWNCRVALRGVGSTDKNRDAVIGLCFLKFAGDKFEKRRAELIAQYGDIPAFLEKASFYNAVNVFYLKETARWAYIVKNAGANDIAVILDQAMADIEESNPSLKGALSLNLYATLGAPKEKIKQLIDEVNKIDESRFHEEDLIGRVYEYFLQVYAASGTKEDGEFYTPACVVQLIAEMIEPYSGVVYEPACGDGNFLSVILKRKLTVVTKKYRRSAYDWERNSLLALGSMYGVDIMLDNVLACQERLFEIWNKEYKKVCKKECNDETREAARFILRLNIVCGNALTLMCCDAEGKELNVPIIFSEWTFPFNDARMQRKDYTFAELLAMDEPKPAKKKKNADADFVQGTLFDMGLDEPEQPDDEGKFLQQYIAHYRHIQDDDTRWREAYLHLHLTKEENDNG